MKRLKRHWVIISTIGIVLIIFIGLFSYKLFSIKLQENKEKAVIQAQLSKEKTVLEFKAEQQEQEKKDQLYKLDNCIKEATLHNIELGRDVGLFNPEIIAKIINGEVTYTDISLNSLIYSTEYHMTQGVCKKLFDEQKEEETISEQKGSKNTVYEALINASAEIGRSTAYYKRKNFCLDMISTLNKFINDDFEENKAQCYERYK